MQGIGFTAWDMAALAFFVLAWAAYHVAVERGPNAARSLNNVMNGRRRGWFEQAFARDNRIIDTQIMASLQNGTAFFTSTSLLAVGGAMALLRASDQAIQLSADLWFLAATTRARWEVKIIGLAAIFAYAFFKFAWSYRLFNYAAILLGALPPPAERETEAGGRALERCVRMNTVAGKHFNRGQRAFFFALAYLGWFLGPLLLVLFTSFVLFVMWNRQFGPDSRHALAEDGP
jgi:uncharacterized membrane protein